MKALAIVFALCAGRLLAFDSAEWHEKRQLLDRECERLQLAYSNCLKRVTAPAENVTVPVESFPDGSVKASVRAAKAQIFLDSPYVWGQGVVLTEFRPDGSVQARIEAENCVIDRKLKCCWVEGRARATYGRTEVRGNGIYFSFAEEYIKIADAVEIRSEDLKVEGVRL